MCAWVELKVNHWSKAQAQTWMVLTVPELLKLESCGSTAMTISWVSPSKWFHLWLVRPLKVQLWSAGWARPICKRSDAGLVGSTNVVVLPQQWTPYHLPCHQLTRDFLICWKLCVRLLGERPMKGSMELETQMPNKHGIDLLGTFNNLPIVQVCHLKQPTTWNGTFSMCHGWWWIFDGTGRQAQITQRHLIVLPTIFDSLVALRMWSYAVAKKSSDQKHARWPSPLGRWCISCISCKDTGGMLCSGDGWSFARQQIGNIW